MKKIRRHYIFSGRVQCVGFRYRAQQIAGHYGVTGWVRNLWSGDVEMEVQGDVQSIEQMIEALYKSKYIGIERIQCADIPVVGEHGFHVRGDY